jgi:hypothetical protein
MHWQTGMTVIVHLASEGIACLTISFFVLDQMNDKLLQLHS